MSFMADIIDWLNEATNWFYGLYLDCYNSVWPLTLIARWFYELCLVCNNLAWAFYYFSSWVSEVASKITQVLSWSTIWSYILSYVPNLTQIRDWFYSWVTNVTNTISSWWSATSVTVRGWIDAAIVWLKDAASTFLNFWDNLWPQFVSSFNGLKSAWDNFWKVTLPDLVSFDWLWSWWNSTIDDVQGLINSAFAARQSFWEGWQDMRTSVLKFFEDPLEWLWERFADWFLGPEG